MENESLKKTKFYDITILIGSASFIILLILFWLLDESFLDSELGSNIMIVFIIIMVITLAIFNWGMIYNKFVMKNYSWLIVDFFLLWVGLVAISNLVFYFVRFKPRLPI